MRLNRNIRRSLAQNAPRRTASVAREKRGRERWVTTARGRDVAGRAAHGPSEPGAGGAPAAGWRRKAAPCLYHGCVEAMGDRRQAVAEAAGTPARLRLSFGHCALPVGKMASHSPLSRDRRRSRRLAATRGGAMPQCNTHRAQGGRLGAAFEAAVSLPCHRLRFGWSARPLRKWPREASEPGPGGVPAIWRQHGAAPRLCKGGRGSHGRPAASRCRGGGRFSRPSAALQPLELAVGRYGLAWLSESGQAVLPPPGGSSRQRHASV